MQALTINNQTIEIKEYQGQRVVTLKDIDRVHGRPEGTAGRNFRKNKMHFIEREDFFSVQLSSDEIRRQFGAAKNAGKLLLLITESGYLMLVKSFTDDLAWKVQRELVNNYFRKHAYTPPKAPVSGYAYTEKFYKGVPVLTVGDLEHLTGLSAGAIQYHLRDNKKCFIWGKDYWLLAGNELREFKIQNQYTKIMASQLYVISFSGIKVLERLMNRKIDLPQQQLPTTEFPLNIENCQPKPISVEKELQNKAVAIQELLRAYRIYDEEKYQYPIRTAVWILAADITQRVYKTGKVLDSEI